jgi:hypothetical protein
MKIQFSVLVWYKADIIITTIIIIIIPDRRRRYRKYIRSCRNIFRLCRDDDKRCIKLPNSEQSYKGKVKTHNYINRKNQSTTGKL